MYSTAVEVAPNVMFYTGSQCQTWIESYTQRLIAEDELPDSSIAVVHQAPKRL
jgi:hypothetical protein